MSDFWGGFGLVKAGAVNVSRPVVDEPVVVEEPVVSVVEEPGGSVLPAVRATVREWVEFMAANGIPHPEDATKAEMKKIAEAAVGEST